MNIGKWVSNPNVDDKSTFYFLKYMIQHIGNNANEGRVNNVKLIVIEYTF
jgi:hypothetical protein